jgi:uncharacterized membrane protein YsdA (DUF1294 family)/cold shock CspA family protein
MRYKGTLETWKDERGFGFLRPMEGGPSIFVHISAFASRSTRPQVGQIFVFEVESTADGKKRATKVQSLRSAKLKRIDSRPSWGLATFLTIPAFVLLYLAVAVIWRVPSWVAAVYFVVSTLCFFYYAKDKSAAATRKWRVPENMLHFLGLLGGWPGAIFAQQLLRHKSKKTEFRAVFWASVIANVVAFLAMFTPAISILRR